MFALHRLHAHITIGRINVGFAGLTMQGDLEMSAGAFGFRG
jgi:hypothetical protein